MLNPEGRMEGQEGFLNCLGPMCFVFFYKMSSVTTKGDRGETQGKKTTKFIILLDPRDTLVILQERMIQKGASESKFTSRWGDKRERGLVGKCLYWDSEWSRQEKARGDFMSAFECHEITVRGG